MATYDQISEILKIPKTTLVDWRKSDDYRSTLFHALKSMSVEELKDFTMENGVDSVETKDMIVKKLQSMTKEEVKDFIRSVLSFEDIEEHLRYVNKDDFKKEHLRFKMSGYESIPGECTTENMAILNKFAYLGIYDYTTYLFLDFYKGNGTLYYQYFRSFSDNIEEDFGGYGTVEIIYAIFERTIFSGKSTRRRQ